MIATIKYKLIEIKWAYQRVVRGYDDRLFWSLSGYVDPLIVACVRNQLILGHGHPIDITKKKWDKALMTILKGFEPEPTVADKKVWSKYLKSRSKALILLTYYWDELWD